MVSRFFIAGRSLAALCLLLCLFLQLAFPPAAMTRTHYTISDGTEGDPGDGVLNPGPIENPDPKPFTNNFPALTIIMIPLGNNCYQPVFYKDRFSENPWSIHAGTRSQIVREVRWHNAP